MYAQASGPRAYPVHSAAAGRRLLFHCEDALMHDAAEPIYDPRAVEVDPGRCLVGHRMVGRAPGEGFQRLLPRTAPDGLEHGGGNMKRDPVAT